MQVRVLAFGILKDWLGPHAVTVELPEKSLVSTLLESLVDAHSRVAENRQPTSSVKMPGSTLPRHALRGIAVSVNAEYAERDQPLREGDEVGLLPPVSGGSATGTREQLPARVEKNFVLLTREPIDAAAIVAACKRDDDGAVVVFDGIVRNHSRGRKTLHLDYEAYEEMALKQMDELVVKARERFGVRAVKIVHRLGRLTVGETGVLIVVASAHRAQAFDASRWLIDTLKQTVPIWKKETFADGAAWAAGEPFPADIAVRPEDGDGC